VQLEVAVRVTESHGKGNREVHFASWCKKRRRWITNFIKPHDQECVRCTQHSSAFFKCVTADDRQGEQTE
jgi:hypothetical protein